MKGDFVCPKSNSEVDSGEDDNSSLRKCKEATNGGAKVIAISSLQRQLHGPPRDHDSEIAVNEEITDPSPKMEHEIPQTNPQIALVLFSTQSSAPSEAKSP